MGSVWCLAWNVLSWRILVAWALICLRWNFQWRSGWETWYGRGVGVCVCWFSQWEGSPHLGLEQAWLRRAVLLRQRYGAYCKQVRQPVPAGGSVFMLRDVGGQVQTRAGPASLFLERDLQWILPLVTLGEDKIIPPTPVSASTAEIEVFVPRLFACLLSNSSCMFPDWALQEPGLLTELLALTLTGCKLKFSSSHFPNQRLWGNLVVYRSPMCSFLSRSFSAFSITRVPSSLQLPGPISPQTPSLCFGFICGVCSASLAADLGGGIKDEWIVGFVGGGKPGSSAFPSVPGVLL